MTDCGGSELQIDDTAKQWKIWAFLFDDSRGLVSLTE
jgi:hypothetical protein